MDESIWNFNMVHLERNEVAVKSTTFWDFLNKKVKCFLFQGCSMSPFSLGGFSHLHLNKYMFQIFIFPVETV